VAPSIESLSEKTQSPPQTNRTWEKNFAGS